jgi:hypothetical protein
MIYMVFRYAHLSSGTFFPSVSLHRFGSRASLCNLFIDIVGPRVCRYHTRDVDLRLFWYSRGIWSVSPFCLCATNTAPPLVLLCCRKPHIPSCGRVLRRGYCYQMLWGIYQVRLYCLADDELRWLMKRTATLSS